MRFHEGLGLSCLALIIFMGRSFAAADGNVEVIGVAKVHDGSAVAAAWDGVEKRRIADSNASAQARAQAVGGAAVADVTPNESTPYPATLVVQTKRIPVAEEAQFKDPNGLTGLTVPATNYAYASSLEAQQGSVVLKFWRLQGYDASDWIAVEQETGSAPAGKTSFATQMSLMKTMLDKMGAPLSADQAQALDTLVSQPINPELIDAWAKVEAAPADLKPATAFVHAYIAAQAASMKRMNDLTTKFANILTPAQQKLLGRGFNDASSSHVSVGSKGSGSIAVSMVSSPAGSSMTVTITGKTLADAFDSLTGALNSSFNANLTVPKVPDAKLAATLVTAKLTLTSADGALEKLANAAGATLQTQGADVVVVAAPSGK